MFVYKFCFCGAGSIGQRGSNEPKPLTTSLGQLPNQIVSVRSSASSNPSTQIPFRCSIAQCWVTSIREVMACDAGEYAPCPIRLPSLYRRDRPACRDVKSVQHLAHPWALRRFGDHIMRCRIDRFDASFMSLMLTLGLLQARQKRVANVDAARRQLSREADQQDLQ